MAVTAVLAGIPIPLFAAGERSRRKQLVALYLAKLGGVSLKALLVRSESLVEYDAY